MAKNRACISFVFACFFLCVGGFNPLRAQACRRKMLFVSPKEVMKNSTGNSLVVTLMSQWVVEGLSWSADATRVDIVAQGDVMKSGGLRISRLHIVPAGLPPDEVY